MSSPAKSYSLVSSYIICIIAYVCALGGAWYFLQNVSIENHLLTLFLADVLATVIIFIFSLAFKNSSLYDAYWSVIPPFMILYWFTVYAIMNSTVVLWYSIVVCFWAVRLTYNWAKGWTGLGHEDWRYKMLREKNPALYPITNFFGIHLFPTVMVFLGMLPVLDTISGSYVYYPVFFLGVICCLIAVVVEFMADEQMRKFKKTARPGEFIETGLWKYSRHPNYFGEIFFWFGLWIMAIGCWLPSIWTGIGWLAMLFMFVFASIPMMEEKNKKNKPGYGDYISRVSMLIPWPPKKKD